jgi:putative ABC transport system permease protein
MDQLDGDPGKASVFWVRTDDLSHQDAVRREILGTEGLGDWSVQTMQEFISTLTPEHFPGFNIGLHVVIGIAAVIGFLVIFQSMYTAVMERTREIGILKSMGAGQGMIVSVVLRETGLLAVCGVVLGIATTYLLRTLLHARFPTLSFQLTGQWIMTATAITLLGALFGALYPALKAARKDPIDALAYE